MSCVPVGNTGLRIAATTYIDEFESPIRNTETRIDALYQKTQQWLLITLVVVGLFAVEVLMPGCRPAPG